jgi:hypothetical protein
VQSKQQFFLLFTFRFWLMIMNKKLLIILLIAGVYLLSTGISYSIFANTVSTMTGNPSSSSQSGVAGSSGNDYQAVDFDQSKSKTEECPLNGVKYSTEQKDWWEKHRPLGVMIENHDEARPQSGISFSDVTYEAVAEGGITRTLNVYYCQDAGIVGPVRSARVYFLDFISEYGTYPLYAHVGGANTPGPANALGQISDMDWTGYNDMNQFSIGFPTFWRDESRLGHPTATEHTMYSTTSKLWAVAEKRSLTNVDKDGTAWNENFKPYSFKEDAASTRKQTIHIEYWKGYDAYFVDWTYSSKDNMYLRKNGGEPHKDRNTNKQLSAKNVVILYMDESNANDGYENNLHLLYKTKGTGNAVVYQDGKEIKAKWQKSGRNGRTILTDTSGDTIKFNRGKIWFHILPIESIVEAN